MIEIDKEDINIEIHNNTKPAKTFKEVLFKVDFLKLVYTLCVMILMCSITYSLIVNPNSLKIENNPFIGLVGGVIIAKFGDLGNMFFPKKENKNG